MAIVATAAPPEQDAAVQRLTIFAKGNADVRDSLHVLAEDGAVRWNGINAVLAERHPDWRARVIHETMSRSDALLGADGAVPPMLAARDLPMGAFAPARQFATRLFDASPDIVVLSIQADVMNRLLRHRGDGYFLYPHDMDVWPEQDRQWLIAGYAPVPPLEPEESMAGLARVVERLREGARDPAVLVFNMSPVVPWERLHCYLGLPETLATRIRRFNLALVGLSRSHGISIVDVDAVIARAGADRLKLDAVTLSAEGCRLVAEEVVRILADLGRLPERAE
jgi:hypothetical protein